jgi:hypothetical protein
MDLPIPGDREGRIRPAQYTDAGSYFLRYQSDKDIHLDTGTGLRHCTRPMGIVVARISFEKLNF